MTPGKQPQYILPAPARNQSHGGAHPSNVGLNFPPVDGQFSGPRPPQHYQQIPFGQRLRETEGVGLAFEPIGQRSYHGNALMMSGPGGPQNHGFTSYHSPYANPYPAQPYRYDSIPTHPSLERAGHDGLHPSILANPQSVSHQRQDSTSGNVTHDISGDQRLRSQGAINQNPSIMGTSLHESIVVDPALAGSNVVVPVGPPEVDDAELSDADSDYQKFRNSLSEFRKEVLTVRKEHGADPIDTSQTPQKKPRQRIGAFQTSGASKKGNHGPRKAAEPTGEIRFLLGKANDAFMRRDYPGTFEFVSEIIRLNAETFEAWNLLATAFREMEDHDNALKALMFAAHLRPKLTEPWMLAAKYALEETGKDKDKYLANAQFAFTHALRADPNNVEARIAKLDVLIKRGNIPSTVTELKHILARSPYDMRALELLAEYCLEDKAPKSLTISNYRNAVDHFTLTTSAHDIKFDWNNLFTYITLLEYDENYAFALAELKRVARWLLGRQDETFWSGSAIEDDSEWDIDDLRRNHVKGYVANRYPPEYYGGGLPAALRFQLGNCRLKTGMEDLALIQFNLLNPFDSSGHYKEEGVEVYLRPAADALFDAQCYEQATVFYRSCLKAPDPGEAEIHWMVGRCHLLLGEDVDAESAFLRAIATDQDDMKARMELARMYESKNKPAEAFQFVHEVMLIRNNQRAEDKLQQLEIQHEGAKPEPEPERATMRLPRAKHIKQAARKKTAPRPKLDENLRSQYLASQYKTLGDNYEGLRSGDQAAIDTWMDAAKDLTDDFRGFRAFYPWDKYIKFLGYTNDNQRNINDGKKTSESSLDSDVSSLVDRLGRDFADNPPKSESSTPADYRGISFSHWLDIFLDYAICVARNGDSKASYELCEAARDCVVFYHSRQDMFLINIAHCMCSLLCSDEETLATVARFFMKDYQFTTDSYHMFSALTRICHSPVSWYCSGPAQKFVLRQIKAMDYALVDEASRENFFSEKGSYTAVDIHGNPLINKDMDIALLMLYGHILYTGTSYAYALNYFLRAHALDPANPIVCLNIGLSYIHQALKRQADNRQHSILEGVTFVQLYYEKRKTSIHASERQEAYYNMAMVYHLLGLSHLAIPYYAMVLSEIQGNTRALYYNTVVINTAYNLQTLFSIAGNIEQARKITARWLQT